MAAEQGLPARCGRGRRWRCLLERRGAAPLGLRTHPLRRAAWARSGSAAPTAHGSRSWRWSPGRAAAPGAAPTSRALSRSASRGQRAAVQGEPTPLFPAAVPRTIGYRDPALTRSTRASFIELCAPIPGPRLGASEGVATWKPGDKTYLRQPGPKGTAAADFSVRLVGFWFFVCLFLDLQCKVLNKNLYCSWDHSGVQKAALKTF